jgi:acyl-CoA thioesterase-1
MPVVRFAIALFVVLLSSAVAARADEKLPRVLILGDSISLGYTEPVRKQLQGTAELHRPKENCQHTGHGLRRIKAWLGDGKWDVIHFNWGIWDTHMVEPGGALIRNEAEYKGEMRIRHTPEQYREHLVRLVDAMEETGARLIWANTTPIMSRSGKCFDDITTLNTVAVKLMRERAIAINDLYAFTLPHADKWQSADKVHFNATGNQQLGARVAESIRTVLAKKPRSDLRSAYRELLALFPEETPGKGLDRGKEGVIADQPMTYGLVLSAEALRYRVMPSGEGKRRVRHAADWILNNSRLASDGKIGWGLPFAWNEYPRHTSYTITTAIVLEGLLDALLLNGFWEQAERERILQTIRDVQLRWCREMWVEGYTGGYFQYSTHETGPDWFCVNAPAMFLGAMARFHNEHASTTPEPERRLFAERMDGLARAILATVELRDGAPYWKYMGV